VRVISITGWKGGVQKTVTSVHLATFLSDKGLVVLVDGDANRSALSWAERGKFSYEVVDQRAAMKSIVGADYVVIDSPARPESEDLKEMAKGSDLLILPVIPDVLSLEPTLKMSQELQGAQYRFLIAMSHPPPNRDGELYRQELADSGIPVFRSIVRRSITVPQAALQGVTVRDLKNERAQAVWSDFAALGKEVLEVLA